MALRPSSRRLLASLAFSLGLSWGHAEPIVIGQSLPLSGAGGFATGNRVHAGALAYINFINEKGGVHGRPLKLVTLDDGNDPKVHAGNVRQLVAKEGAVVIVNCLDDTACKSGATAAAELGVPLVGPLAGSRELRQRAARHVFSVRPSHEREAELLVRQLQSMGLTRVALLSDGNCGGERAAALATALGAGNIHMERLAADGGADKLIAALRDIGKASQQGVVLDLGLNSIDVLGQLPPETLTAIQDGLPGVVATTSAPGLTQLSRLFRGRVLGFTMVVPNPETSNLALIRDLNVQSERASSADAITFEGLESYLHLRLVVEALRRAGPRVDATKLQKTLAEITTLDLGGFKLSFREEPRNGSDWMEIGMRSRTGRMLR
ncbi:ABC transporter substrate-binding protein [Hydrogenophaga pseudoflava]|uniref:ABC transporter substrate-binding protein n=1 Tax=Hydrogenophaga pseudoflava TaxID=47421 RepID=UPI0027E51ACA|nr:ABC transporter substrate-binding protein [Hydrogenophaga pseudoflava]MDQ7747294.1 ABC transporter substrate-binding protein [Hydrogenophaga pseudoflava]